jgi:uncharacterized protein DUF6843
MRRILVGLLLVPLLGIGVALTTLEFKNGQFLVAGFGRPIRVELPPGYRGWVVIEYDNPKCPPFRVQGLVLVIDVSASGRGCTSSPIPRGWRSYRYDYVHADGTRTQLRTTDWDGEQEVWQLSYHLREQSDPRTYEVLFIGTKAERDQSWTTQPPTRLPEWWETEGHQ